MLIYRWSLIAGRLPGRTDNEIKNYWNTHIRRKLLNRGIDPSTHRPINDPSPDVTTISFSAAAAATAAVKEEDKISISGFGCKTEKNPVTERCPDLNLELRISPPYQPQTEPALLKTGGRSSGSTTLCFACSLGIQNTEECSCSMGTSSGSSSSGYDFLGLKSGVLDYRSLEMK